MNILKINTKTLATFAPIVFSLLFFSQLMAQAQNLTPDLGVQLNKEAIIQKLITQTNATSPTITPAVTNSWSNWATTNYSLEYIYNYNHSFLNGSVTSKNGGIISLLFNVPFNFLVFPSLSVSGSEVKNLAGNQTANVLAIAPAVQMGHVVFRDLTKNLWDGNLTVYGKIGYAAADTSTLVGTSPAFSEGSGWQYGLNGQWTVNPLDNLKISLAPGFMYVNNRTANVPVGTTTETYEGDISLRLTCNYTISWVSQNLVISPGATWLRNLTFSVAPGQSLGYQDWAEFSFDLMYTFRNYKGHGVTFDAGYMYDAFNKSYYADTASLQFKYSF